MQIKGTTGCLQVAICGHSYLHKQHRPRRPSLPLPPLFFLFISLSLFWLVWDRFVLSNEEGSRCEKVPVFLSPTGIGPITSGSFFAVETMHWRHTPRLELGISHGKMFPEFRSQARGKAEDGVRVRGREVKGGGRHKVIGGHSAPLQAENHQQKYLLSCGCRAE